MNIKILLLKITGITGTAADLYFGNFYSTETIDKSLTRPVQDPAHSL